MQLRSSVLQWLKELHTLQLFLISRWKKYEIVSSYTFTRMTRQIFYLFINQRSWMMPSIVHWKKPRKSWLVFLCDVISDVIRTKQRDLIGHLSTNQLLVPVFPYTSFTRFPCPHFSKSSKTCLDILEVFRSIFFELFYSDCREGCASVLAEAAVVFIAGRVTRLGMIWEHNPSLLAWHSTQGRAHARSVCVCVCVCVCVLSGCSEAPSGASLYASVPW